MLACRDVGVARGRNKGVSKERETEETAVHLGSQSNFNPRVRRKM